MFTFFFEVFSLKKNYFKIFLTSEGGAEYATLHRISQNSFLKTAWKENYGNDYLAIMG